VKFPKLTSKDPAERDGDSIWFTKKGAAFWKWSYYVPLALLIIGVVAFTIYGAVDG
jgi:hypothetical protein